MQPNTKTSAEDVNFDEDLAALLRLQDEHRLLGGYARYLAPDPRSAERLVSETLRRARRHPRAMSRRNLLVTMRQVLRQGN